MNILFIGDIVGKPGRKALGQSLKKIRGQYHIDFCVGNGENAAGGFGLTPETANELFDFGIDVITSGNHIFDKQEILQYLSKEHRILRPANYPAENPGKGWILVKVANGEYVAVLNLIGRVHMDAVDCPFKKADIEIPRLRQKTGVIVVDMHAEVTSEKNAMGWYLDGRASAVVGTHTHVPTADERVLPQGTAHISDVGMTGCYNSVIGMEKAGVLKRFVERVPARFEVASGPASVCGVILDIDETTGKSRSIARVRVNEKD